MPKRTRIDGILIDLSGTVHIGDKQIPGAAEAIQKLRDHGRRVRFLTNTSTKSSTTLLQQLAKFGINLRGPEELVTSIFATRSFLQKHGLRPFCLMEDTSDLEMTSDSSVTIDLEPPHNCVVIGLAPTKLNYQDLNKAFRILLESQEANKLIAIHKAPYLRDVDGELSLGPGGFCNALEMSADCQAMIMGKPSPAFFASALWSDIPTESTCMIGDEIRQDIEGAHLAGVGTTLLVKTGKYREGDETKVPDAVTKCCNSLVDAVDYILAQD